MDKYIDMRMYGLSDRFTKEFEGHTISRILSQEKGIYHIVAKEKRFKDIAKYNRKNRRK